MKKLTSLSFLIIFTLIAFAQAPRSLYVKNQPSLAPEKKVHYEMNFSEATKASYLTQNFDVAPFPPTTWTTQILLTTKTWQSGNPSAAPFSTIDPTNVNSAIVPYSSVGQNQNEWLITPSITGTSSASSLFIKFWAGFSYDYLPVGGGGNPGATLKCKISTDGGSTWTDLWDANNTPSLDRKSVV